MPIMVRPEPILIECGFPIWFKPVGFSLLLREVVIFPFQCFGNGSMLGRDNFSLLFLYVYIMSQQLKLSEGVLRMI